MCLEMVSVRMVFGEVRREFGSCNGHDFWGVRNGSMNSERSNLKNVCNIGGNFRDDSINVRGRNGNFRKCDRNRQYILKINLEIKIQVKVETPHLCLDKAFKSE